MIKKTTNISKIQYFIFDKADWSFQIIEIKIVPTNDKDIYTIQINVNWNKVLKNILFLVKPKLKINYFLFLDFLST
ncbi:hypothetical protein CG009_01250 [Mesoplasma florum]|nr:hypothetical protein CG009_01250 [Mesoplasma florum]